MARTAGFSIALGILFAWSWSRLEDPQTGIAPLLLMVALGLAPAFLPTRRLRLAGLGLALLLAAGYALDARPYALGTLVSRAGRGFLDFYDVTVPFNGSAHRLMDGVVLLAVFLFTALAALAVRARRPLLASLVMVAGAGWPATIYPTSGDLGRGAILLVFALALVAQLKPSGRRAAPQVLVGTVLVVVALIASSSGAVAKPQFLNWQKWDFSSKEGPRVSVSYVWKSNYSGISFPKKRTRVFTVRGPARSAYWRATTLDAFKNDHWQTTQISVPPIQLQLGNTNVDAVYDDTVQPDVSADPRKWKAATVHVEALRDTHLVSPSGVIAYQSGAVQSGVQYTTDAVAEAFQPVPRGTNYTAWAYQPQPKPSQLAKSRPDYPSVLTDPRSGGYLEVAPGRVVPPFGTQERTDWLRDAFSDPSLRPYQALERQADSIAGAAKSPYAATVAIEAWLRSGGGFAYSEKPRQIPGIPPLVAFVTQTQTGYCQHFAGAMALMLRYLGIPARLAAGFTSGAFDVDKDDSSQGTWRVNDNNAHVWVEVWFKGYGWLPFDPTPGRGNLGGPYTASSISFDAPGAEKILKATAMASVLSGVLGHPGQSGPGAAGATGGDVAKGRGGGSVGESAGIARYIVLAALGLVLLFLAAKLAVRRRRFFSSDPREIATACRRELVGYLMDVGITIPRALSLADLREHVRKRTGVDSGRLVASMGLARFGPPDASAAAAREARSELRAVRKRLRRAIPFSRRARGLFSVRSLFASGTPKPG
jgi:protein-glutamine gamma-glutamyltransferase